MKPEMALQNIMQVMVDILDKMHMVCLAFALLLIASYAVLPQPKFEAPSSEKAGVTNFDNSTAYIKQDRTGQHWLCIQNEQPMRLTESEAAFFHQTGLAIIKE